jgi:hypothetical protein
VESNRFGSGALAGPAAGPRNDARANGLRERPSSDGFRALNNVCALEYPVFCVFAKSRWHSSRWHSTPETEHRIGTILMEALTEATARSHAASDAFSAVMGDVPSALPHPDGAQRIHNVSRELSAARKEVMLAHSASMSF